LLGAQRHGWLHEHALACELAARYYLGRALTGLGAHYLRRAWHGYTRWGARAKVTALERRHPALLREAMFDERRAPPRERTDTGSRLSASLDFHSVLKASQAIADKIVVDELLRTLMRTVLENAGASRGALVLQRAGRWLVEAQGASADEELRVLEGAPVASEHLPLTAFNLVTRTQEPLVVSNATREEPFARDPYILSRQPQSFVCLPLLHQRALLGVLYLENDLIPGAFNRDRLTVINLLSAQIVISIRNSARYADLEHAVAERTAALRETNASLSVSNRELDAFAHTVAHDLKIPLGTLIGYTELIDEGLEPDELRDVAARIRRTSRDMATIVEELLLLASVRRGSVEPRPVDMREVVERSLQRLVGMLERRGLTPDAVERPARWAPVLGYAPWIEEVLVNYLSNALKYGGPSPTITLGQTREPSGELRCFVRDDGPGIAPEIQGRLFQEFAQLHVARVDGHGLGLSIVRRIITRLGGRVGVESELGAGATFYFCLPPAPDDAPPDAATA
ncbi:MAG: GAF domain-containing sensor histidine kinase, partial [Myxococcales bacterium]|nr:GAF domain-containing sensor histidine kinase [Myxococcales bacterium]